MNSRRAWVVFTVATFAYLVAVTQRSSLGIAGVDATDRFGIQAATLSTLAVVQIIVYAALQIPVGVVLDRLGPRAMIIAGAALMAIGQAVLALVPEFGAAVGGRILVGAGDALTFISAQRIVVSWFSGKRVPLVSQLLGTVGQFGQLLSAIPLSFILHSAGWEPAYVSAAGLSVVVVVVGLALLKNQPDAATVAVPLPGKRAVRQLREALARPGTQLGFWSHFVSQSSVTVFSLLWGFPFLSVGLGYGPDAASLLLSLTAIAAIVGGPILGILAARYPYRRSNLVIAIVCAMAIVWGAVLLWPGHPPLWLVILLIIVIGVGAPGSLIGFDFARTFNPARSLGSANGIVNVGGFLAGFVMMFLIGLVLDAIDSARGGTGVPAELYSLSSFRIAFLVQYVVVGFGVVMLMLARRRTRSRVQDDEGITVGPLWVALLRRWRRSRSREA